MSGDLEITVNDPNVNILYEVFKNGKYAQESVKFGSDATIKQVDGIEAYTNTTKDLREMATKFYFIAYTIRYKIELKGRSIILCSAQPKMQVDFFPFMRPSLHRAEVSLDRLLLSDLRKAAEELPEVELR